MRLGITAGLLALFFGGCLSGLPLDTLSMDRVQEIKKEEGSGAPLSLVVAVQAGEAQTLSTTELGEDRYAVSYSAADVADGVARDIDALHLVLKVQSLPWDGEANERTLRERAREQGADLCLMLKPLSKEVTYLGHNGWWVPNLLLWAVVLVPAWFVPDETYRTDIEFEAALFDLRTGTEILRKSYRGSQELRLNDFQRGWHVWSVFAGAIDASNYEEAGREIGPLARNRARADLYVELAQVLNDEDPTQEEPAAPDRPVGGPVAVVVGVDHPRSMKAMSMFAAADALRFSKFLGSHADGSSAQNVVLLRNDEATLPVIREKLIGLARGADRVYFYFAGFGVRHEGRAYLVPAGGNPEKPSETCLSVFEIALLMKGSGAKGRFLFLDAGFSGTGARSAGSGKGELAKNGFTKADPSKGGTGLFLAAGPSGNVLEGGEYEGGLFTTVLINGLQGPADQNRDSRFTAAEIAGYLAREVPTAALSNAAEQTPLFLGGPESVVIEKREERR
jgi:hypothetical protein